MEKPSIEGFEEFGANAEATAMLFMRAHVPVPDPMWDGMILCVLVEMFSEAELERLLAIVDEKERAFDQEEAAAAIEAERAKRKGWIGQFLAWINAPAPAPRPTERRPDYGIVRNLVTEAMRAQWKKTLDDAFADFDAGVAARRRWEAEQN